MSGLAQTPIRFHRLTDAYGAFTNFARYPVLLDGAVWPTAEHFFQASKFDAPDAKRLVVTAPTPSAAARIGRRRDLGLRRDWSTYRVHVMRRAVYAKFCQHAALRLRLTSTGTRRLVEDTAGDRFWGAGADGRGENRNGVILEEVRDYLVSTATALETGLREHLRIPLGARYALVMAAADAALLVRPRGPASTDLAQVAAAVGGSAPDITTPVVATDLPSVVALGLAAHWRTFGADVHFAALGRGVPR